MQAIICDIDGTLADLHHRVHHVQGGRKDWPAFFATMQDDLLIEPIANLVTTIHADGTAVLLVSGRPENYRDATEAWLSKQGIPYDGLYMRPADDQRPDHIVKSQLLDGILADGYEITLVIDDRPSVVAMWRERGLCCLQADHGIDSNIDARPGLLTLMVGPSGAGKSTWLNSDAAKHTWGISSAHVISSDQIRADICGDFRDQTRNPEVFDALHAVVRTRLRHGLPTVVDATNLRRKDRLAVVGLAPVGAQIRYIIIDRSMADKERDAGWRAEVPGLLAKHDQTFRSQLKDILSGDGLPNVMTVDLRRLEVK